MSLPLCLCLTACSHPPKPRPTPGTAPSALVLPPRPETLPTLATLDSAAHGGDLDAAWQRAHYLLDLFDDARYRRDTASFDTLWRALATARPEPPAANSNAETPTHGPAATERAIAALQLEVDRVLAIDRMHVAASAARRLLEFDAARPHERSEVLQRMSEIKAAARIETITGNATLRLANYCLRALEDAASAPWSEAATMLAHCLYPLYPADPAPYFAADPKRRPPPPRWPDIVNDLDRLLASGAMRARRLAPTLQAMRDKLARLAKERGHQLPEAPDPEELKLATVDYARPYDWTPILPTVSPGQAEAVASEISGPLEGDGRAVAALPLPPSIDRASFNRSLDAARLAGAAAVDLLVAFGQTVEVPRGDYWATHSSSGHFLRLAAIRIALSTTPASDDTPSRGPNRPLWDGSRAALGLALVIEPARWLLTSPDGDVGTVDPRSAPGDPRTQLRVMLSRVRSAFPEEAGLTIVMSPTTQYTQLLRAASAASLDENGRPLFSFLAFADAVPTQNGSGLARRIERRRRARVNIEPAALSVHGAALRTCYQTLLEKRPALSTTADLQRKGTTLTVTLRPRQPALARCIHENLDEPMSERDTVSARIRFTPQ